MVTTNEKELVAIGKALLKLMDLPEFQSDPIPLTDVTVHGDQVVIEYLDLDDKMCAITEKVQ